MPESSLDAFARFLAKWFVKGRRASGVIHMAVRPYLARAFTATLGTRKRKILAASLVLAILVGLTGMTVGGNYSEEQARIAAVAVKAEKDATLATAAASRKLRDSRSDAAERLITGEGFRVESADYAAPEDSAALAAAITNLRTTLYSGTAAEVSIASSKVSILVETIGARPIPHDWRISCNDAKYTAHDFATFRDVWASPLELVSCTPGTMTGDFYTDIQNAAVTSGASPSIDRVGTLYSVCASLSFGSYGSLASYSESQVKELTGALTICPDQPSAPLIQLKITAAAKAAADLASGAVFGSGVRRVGDNIQPGVYVSEGSAGCYWERLDSTGEIIDNNFIMGATRAEVTVRSSDYSFNSTGCSQWRRE